MRSISASATPSTSPGTPCCPGRGTASRPHTGPHRPWTASSNGTRAGTSPTARPAPPGDSPGRSAGSSETRVQPFLQNDGVVALLVLRGEEQRDRPVSGYGAREVLGGGIRVQLLHVPRAEPIEPLRVVVEPFPEVSGWRDVLRPHPQGEPLLGYASGPQAVHQDAEAVVLRRLRIGPLGPDADVRHDDAGRDEASNNMVFGAGLYRQSPLASACTMIARSRRPSCSSS